MLKNPETDSQNSHKIELPVAFGKGNSESILGDPGVFPTTRGRRFEQRNE